MISVNALSSANGYAEVPETASQAASTIEQAEAYLAAGLIVEAAELFSNQVNSQHSSRAHMGLSQCAYYRRELHEALGHLQIIARMQPDYPDLHNNLGVVLFEMGLIKEAQEQFLHATRKEPQNIQPWRNLIDLSLSSQDYVSCVEYCHHILELVPDDPEAKIALTQAQEHLEISSNNSSARSQPSEAAPSPMIQKTVEKKQSNYCDLSALSVATAVPPPEMGNQNQPVEKPDANQLLQALAASAVAKITGTAPASQSPSNKQVSASNNSPSYAVNPGVEVNEATKTNADAMFQVEKIDGVVLRSLSYECDERGYATEMVWTKDHPAWRLSRMAVVGSLTAKTIRGFQKHLRHGEYLFINQGSAKIVLIDDRADSSTHGQMQVVISSERNPIQVAVPPGVYYGWMALADNTQLMAMRWAQSPTEESTDEIHLPADSYGDVWSVKAK
jgi:dTDP-4-dehydrorhamnose 3,5-epimerase